MLLKNLSSNEDGSVLIIIGFLLLVCFGVLALTIDMNISQGEYESNQGAVDAAAVAAADFYERKQAQGIEKPEGYEDIAELVHEQNTMLDQSNSELTEFDVQIVGDQVNVRACLEVTNGIAPVAGLAETTLVCNTSTHKIRETEMKFVLIYVVYMIIGSTGVSSSIEAVEFESKASCEAAANAISGGHKFARNNSPLGYNGNSIVTVAECFKK